MSAIHCLLPNKVVGDQAGRGHLQPFTAAAESSRARPFAPAHRRRGAGGQAAAATESCIPGADYFLTTRPIAAA
jgi:hypothetical protein